MGWKIISLFFLLAGILSLPIWPFGHPWPSDASLAICGFCFFVAGLTFLVSILGRRGSTIWRHRGQG